MQKLKEAYYMTIYEAFEGNPDTSKKYIAEVRTKMSFATLSQ